MYSYTDDTQNSINLYNIDLHKIFLQAFGYFSVEL